MAVPDRQAPPHLEPLMSIEDVCGVLRISERGVYRLISRGELVALKVGNRTLLEPAEVREFIANRRQEVHPTLAEETAA